MLKTLQHKVVSNSPAQRVAVELIRRGWKRADLAKVVGVTPKILTNVLCGNKPGKAMWLKIEEVLCLPLVSTSEEIIARLDTPEKLKAYERALLERFGGQVASSENFGQELQQITAALGLTIVVVQFDGSPNSPFWKSGDTAEPFAEEIAKARAGQFDDAKMLEGSWFCFYHVSDLAKALTVLKKGIEQRGLLDHARIFYIEAETSGWRMVWPATGELVLPSPWNT